MIRVFSNGGGVQSVAALVLSAQKRIDYPVHVFVNVGDQAEHPDTLAYVREYAMPYARAHGIEFVEIRRRSRTGEPMDLYEYVMAAQRSIPIPMRMANGAPGNRICTGLFKIKALSQYLRSIGATPKQPAAVGLGISLDEYHRMRTESDEKVQRLEYPLIDLRISRDQCHRIIRDAGLPTPPKSSCWFCPFRSLASWMEMRQTQPDLFDRAAALERTINDRRAALGKDPIWLTRFNRPLDAVVGDQRMLAFDDPLDACESGYCLT